MTPGKRAFDLTLCVLALCLLWPVMLVIAVVILLIDGRPVIYASERMRGPATGFTLWKFRTMRPDSADQGVTGADKESRITRTGRVLRATRLDELPQLFNVLAGDLSLVGPRPPLRRYVEAAPELYRAVLVARPGLTGLATLVYRRHEERILADCHGPDETHAAYLRRCVPAKARLDRIYLRHRGICLDACLLWRTVTGLLRRG